MASDFKTIFTSVDTTELQYSPVEWTLVSLQLETSGPVVAGTKPEMAPIASGKGILLSARPRYFLLGPSERLYTLSSALNRVSMSAHTLPNLVTLALKADALIGALAKKIGLLRP